MDPYSPPENSETQKSSSGPPLSGVLPRLIGAADIVVGLAIAWMIIDYPIASIAVIALTSLVAWGLLQMRIWGWWTGMIFHSAIAAAVTIGYAILMFLAVRDFATPPNHMALVTPEGFAVILTILFLVAITGAVVPVVILRMHRCRIAFGIFKQSSPERIHP